jgi:RNA polymerase sigma-70 factor (ECF subfamily)
VRTSVSNDRAPNAHPAAAERPRVFDDATIARFRRGDREAFLIVYDAHASHMRSLVARFFSRPFEREEALQEIWLLAHRMVAAYDPERGQVLPWLRVLGANRCKELLRAQGRRPAPDVDLDPEALAEPSDPEQVAQSARARDAVARFERALGAEEARVFRLSLVEERAHEEVARAVGITVRRCKYLRMKLLLRAAADGELRRALAEVTGS